MTNIQRNRTMQTATTSLAGGDVLAAARKFFSRESGIYAAFIEQEGPTHISLRGMGGEEVVIGVAGAGSGTAGTAVTASSYMFDQQVALFLSALPSVTAPAAGAAS